MTITDKIIEIVKDGRIYTARDFLRVIGNDRLSIIKYSLRELDKRGLVELVGKKEEAGHRVNLYRKVIRTPEQLVHEEWVALQIEQERYMMLCGGWTSILHDYK